MTNNSAQTTIRSESPPPYQDEVIDTKKHIDPGYRRSQAIDELERLPYNLHIKFFPATPGTQVPINSSWAAHLEVKVRDMTRLMKRGFHWTAANAEMEKGFIMHADGDYLRLGWNCVRVYYLSDLSETPQWTARLFVFAKEFSVLSKFRVGDLKTGQIVHAIALSKVSDSKSKCEYVYSYNRMKPKESFNTFYDDMPLGGFWPWPKVEEEGQRAEENNNSKTNTEVDGPTERLPFLPRM